MAQLSLVHLLSLLLSTITGTFTEGGHASVGAASRKALTFGKISQDSAHQTLVAERNLVAFLELP